MALWTDVATPDELTVVAREAARDREQRDAMNLARFLPDEHSLSQTVTLEAGENGFVDAAEYRAYDAETPIGGRGLGASRITFELPPLGQKRRVSEYDQLARLGNGGESAIRDAIGKATVLRAQAVADRVELERGRVLTSGKAVINENGFKIDSEFGRSPDLTVTLGTPWSDASSNPIEDMLAWAESYVDTNGEAPAYMVASTKAISALTKFQGFLPKDSLRSRASFDEINALLAVEGLPELVRYDRRVRVNGEALRVIPENVVLLLPDESAGLGKTYWGTTLESLDPRYGIAADDRPGIVAGAYQDDDPMGVWVKASAIAMPALANANLALAATVL